MTETELKRRYPNASKSFLARNAEPVGGLEHPQREHNPLPALVHREKSQRGRKTRVAICVSITSYRKRETDWDNIVSGSKPIQDAIAQSLGLDDGDSRLRFEYHTIVTRGATGTHVLISTK